MPRGPESIGVLVVEDHMAMRKIVKTVLQAIDIKTVFEAGNGKEALTVLESETGPELPNEPGTAGRGVDMIICDWSMPEMSGIELLRRVRADRRFQHLPFLMLTAESEKENILKAVELGVSDYIVKPFSAAVLEGKIRSVLLALS
jgi:two-component system chemotaxis response regulator CheY